MNPQVLALVTEFVIPWFMTKRSKPKKSNAPKAIKDIHENYEFSPKRSAVNALIAAALMFAVESGYISIDSQNCLQGAAQEVTQKIEQASKGIILYAYHKHDSWA